MATSKASVTASGDRLLHPDHLDDSVETDEIPGVPGVEGQAVGDRSRGDEQSGQP